MRRWRDSGARADAYPFAVAGVNITRMICDLVLLQDGSGGVGHAMDARAIAAKPWWRLLDEKDAVAKLYSMAFLLLDRAWNDGRGDAMSFNAELHAVREELDRLLHAFGPNGPHEVESLWCEWVDRRAAQTEGGGGGVRGGGALSALGEVAEAAVPAVELAAAAASDVAAAAAPTLERISAAASETASDVATAAAPMIASATSASSDAAEAVVARVRAALRAEGDADLGDEGTMSSPLTE